MADVLSQTPPILHGPSEKERKYDRQLRLWAASGQAALESANILLVNSASSSGTVGVETLKNLVLPGIGRFVIADSAQVTDRDLGVNFFLDDSSRGKPRAQCCTEFLLELNPEVQGDWMHLDETASSLAQFLESAPPFTSILLVLPQPTEIVQALQQYTQRNKTPLFTIHSAGFYSYFHISLPSTFPIVDTHPDDNATTDLRLLQPWPELSDFAATMSENMDQMEAHEHGHIPFVVIILNLLEKWKSEHGSSPPTTYKDKKAFGEMISRAMRRDNPEGGEENFEEAVAAVMQHVTLPPLPSTLKEVFEYPSTPGQAPFSFWTIAKAVKTFYEKYQQLPVAGGLPDMKAKSDVYIKLQNLYKAKARSDAREIISAVREMPGGADIDQDEIELFCTSARFIKLVNSSQQPKLSLEQILEQEMANDEIAAIAGPEMPLSLLPVYLALAANSQDPEATGEAITASIYDQIPSAKGKDRITKVAQEVARAAGAELHNVSATTGGMVAQEMIKIVTKQYIPIDNTCIFDGIQGRCQVLRL